MGPFPCQKLNQRHKMPLVLRCYGIVHGASLVRFQQGSDQCTLGGFRGSGDIKYFQIVEIFSFIKRHHLWAKKTNVQKHHFKATNWKNNNIVP